jgi:hypothetical protein
MPVIPVSKVVDEKRIIGKMGLRRRRAWGHWPQKSARKGHKLQTTSSFPDLFCGTQL